LKGKCLRRRVKTLSFEGKKNLHKRRSSKGWHGVKMFEPLFCKFFSGGRFGKQTPLCDKKTRGFRKWTSPEGEAPPREGFWSRLPELRGEVENVTGGGTFEKNFTGKRMIPLRTKKLQQKKVSGNVRHHWIVPKEAKKKKESEKHLRAGC